MQFGLMLHSIAFVVNLYNSKIRKLMTDRGQRNDSLHQNNKRLMMHSEALQGTVFVEKKKKRTLLIQYTFSLHIFTLAVAKCMFIDDRYCNYKFSKTR